MAVKKQNGKDKKGNGKKSNVVDLKVIKGNNNKRPSSIFLSDEQMDRLKKELDEYKINIPSDIKGKEFIKIAEAIIKNNGFIMKTAISLGLSYKKFRNLLDENEKLSDLIQDTTEAMLDLAENKLREQIMFGNLSAIIYFLSNKGAARGWRNEYKKAGEVIEEAGKLPVFNYQTVLPKNFKLVENSDEAVNEKR